MKYIDADRLKAEIEKHIKEVKDAAEKFTPNMGFFDAKLSGIYDVMAIINSLQQEQPAKRGYKDCNGCEYNRPIKDQIGWQFRGCFGGDYKGKPIAEIELCPLKVAQQEQPSEELEEAAKTHAKTKYGLTQLLGSEQLEVVDDFKAGAMWQKSQDESRRMVNIQLANTDTPVDTEMEVAFNDIWRDAEVIVERDGTLDEKATELMKAVCHDFFESGKEWQKKQMGEQARKELAKTDITLADLVAFDEGLKLGRSLERQDMLKDAVDGVLIDILGLHIQAPLNPIIHKLGLKDGDKVKIVIVKEDKK